MSLDNKHITDFQSLQRERILKSYNTPELQKAEGSRGGTVIGHTKSGKPIYEHSIHNSAGFSKQDHSDAISAHEKAAKNYAGRESKRRSGQGRDEASRVANEKRMVEHHSYMAQEHQKAMSQASDEGSDQKTDLHFDKRQAMADMLAKEKGLKKSEEMSDELVKAYETLGLSDLLEKAEGSRGGKVIGHTKSGKPIYDTFEHSGHKDFSRKEHIEAAHKHAENYHKHGKDYMEGGSHEKQMKNAKDNMDSHIKASGVNISHIDQEGVEHYK